jgi:eukaryotic-like serine/threonine-protein kinase
MADTEGGDLTLAIATGVAIGREFANRYRVEALLGRGGMGSVYRVHDREVDEPVALKLLDPVSTTPEAIDRFRREVRLARRVTHRNAARTYDLGEHDGWRFLTMELIDGESLRARLSLGRQKPARTVEVARQIAEGIAAAHAAGVIHRDLKPANVLVERGSGRVVITDFGIARGLAGGDATLGGGLIGTPAYMAPEQVLGAELGPATDIYALGLMLFEMLTGRLPFVANTPTAIALARLHEPLPELEREPGIPRPLVGLLTRALAREPEQRLASATELTGLLAAAAAELDSDVSTLDLSDEHTRGPATSSVRPTPTTSTRTSLTVTTSPGSGRALAVLPFRFRGPEAERYVAESLGEELIDLLSTTRGLRVLGSGATARFADASERDPRTIGVELGVDVIVDGTVQLAGNRIRIAARLLAVDSGFQLWSERYDGALEHVFELQDKMGKRIAEALRLELEDIVHRGDAPAEAIEAYLRARQLARTTDWRGPAGAVALFERCLELAPAFKPALAGRAIATLRAWFLPTWDPNEPDWGARAQAAVAAAESGAPELAETHLARATLAVQHGEYREAADALRQALQIAPTYAEAHDYLGRLQLEAGRPEHGIAHVELALALDPNLIYGLPLIARYQALREDLPKYEETLARFVAALGRGNDTPTAVLELRVATWIDDRERLARVHGRLTVDGPESASIVGFAAMLVTPEIDEAAMRGSIDSVIQVSRNPRFAALVWQLAAEAAAYRGFDRLALDYITTAAEGVLVDLDWFDHCPLFASLRREPSFERARQLVRRRAETIWTVG